MPVHPWLTHPRTGLPLVADYVTRRGKVIWPVIGGSGPLGEPPPGDGDGGTGGPPQPPPGPGNPPAPTGTLSQADVDRIVEERLRRDRAARDQELKAKYGDLDALSETAKQHQALMDSTKSEQERAVADAEKRGRDAAEAEAKARLDQANADNARALVAAEFRAAAKGALADDTVKGLIEDLDLSKYLGDDGQPDLARIQARVDSLAPAKPGTSRIDLGQGQRTQPPSGGTAAGADLWAQRHPARST